MNDDLERLLKKELSSSRKVLDLGCGPNSPLHLIRNNPKPLDVYAVGVDIFSPYIEMNRAHPIHSEYLQADIFDIDFPDNSLDCAILLDVIEHFDKDNFLKFLPKLQKIAKKIIILVPNGFIQQEMYDDNDHQEHKSGWTFDEMSELGFDCVGLNGLRILRGEHAVARIKPLFLGELLCGMTRPFLFNKPKLAFHLFCVKNNHG